MRGCRGRSTILMVGAGLALSLGGLADAASARRLHRPRAVQVRPRAFASCAQLVGYARRHYAVTKGVPDPPPVPIDSPPLGRTPGRAPAAASAPAAAPSGAESGGAPSFSTTNNQETGVDEPDTAKSDGTTIYAVALNKVFAVSPGASPRLLGSVDLGNNGGSAKLLLRGHRLIVISRGGPIPALGAPVRGAPGRFVASPYYFTAAKTVITELDVTHPSAMRVTRTMTVDGTFVDARQNGGSARLVISSAPRGIVAPALRSRAAAWIPARHFHSALSGRRYTRAVAACTTVRRPVQFSGLGMLTILTVDLDRGLYASDSKALMADAEIVYGSPHSLYVATERWIDPSTAVDRLPTNQTTVIDRFDATDPRTTTFVASGEVPGYLLNQFSLSEHNGYLRAASTSRPIWWFGRPRSTSQSYVTVLAQQGPVLAPVGQVDGLGVGQQIRSVRFVRNAGYVVTFRQIDPLYTLDLSAPTAPRVAGQLELQGYSAYLHPLSPGRLLGVGQDVNPSGSEPSGVQLELFDVSRPSSPRLLARQTLGQGSSSSVNFDHHAFLYWPPTKLAMLPVEIYPDSSGTAPGSIPPGASGSGTASSPPSGPATADSSGSSFVGAIGYHVDGGISELGRVSHDASSGYPPAIQRSLVVGPHVFTISDTGVMASTLSTLAREGFVAFPAPPPPPNPQPAPAPGGPPQPAPAARPAPSAHG